jgi:hypothetical protein
VQRLSEIGWIALAAITAGLPTYFLHWWIADSAESWRLPGLISGLIVLVASGLLYAVVYLALTRFWKLLDPADVAQLMRWLRPLLKFR